MCEKKRAQVVHGRTVAVAVILIVCTYVRMCMCVHMCACLCMGVLPCACLCMCTYVRTCASACMCVHVCGLCLQVYASVNLLARDVVACFGIAPPDFQRAIRHNELSAGCLCMHYMHVG